MVVTEPGLAELPEPDTTYGGKGIDDFHKRGILASSRKSVSLLDPRKRRLLIFAAGLQVSLGLLDLIGIAIIGLVAAGAVCGIGCPETPPTAQTWP